MKRIFDLILTGIGLVLLSPFLLLVAAMINGPAANTFRQGALAGPAGWLQIVSALLRQQAT
jgi:lipopolysaccharide/colanic/teichoic acid biosynthesis glycosyltransferase